MESNETSLSMQQEQAFFSPLSSNSFFFHSSSFINVQDGANFCFSLIKAEEETIGRICFTAEGTTAVSLLRSSFGSFELAMNCDRKQLSFFVDKLLIKLKKQGFDKLKIISFPKIYDAPYSDLIYETLKNFNFEVIEDFTNQFLPVGESDFFNMVKGDERRYLNRAKKRKLDFRKLDIHYLPLAYDLIRTCREAKGYSISMTYPELKQTIERFPDQYLLFGLFLDEQMLASSVCVKVNENILYDFYHGDDLNFRKYSPVVPLIEGIYNYARKQQFKILDLGTSVEEGVYTFKKNLGALDSEKVVFEKVI